MAMAAPLLATAPSPVPPASRRWRPLLAAPAPALRLKLPAPRPPQTPPLPRESRAVSVVRAATEEERGQAPDWRAPATWLALLGSAVLLGCGAALAAAEDSIRASGFGLRVAASLRTLATLPVLELRGAIPAGYWMRLHPIRLTVLAVLVSLLQLVMSTVCLQCVG